MGSGLGVTEANAEHSEVLNDSLPTVYELVGGVHEDGKPHGPVGDTQRSRPLCRTAVTPMPRSLVRRGAGIRHTLCA